MEFCCTNSDRTFLTTAYYSFWQLGWMVEQRGTVTVSSSQASTAYLFMYAAHAIAPLQQLCPAVARDGFLVPWTSIASDVIQS